MPCPILFFFSQKWRSFFSKVQKLILLLVLCLRTLLFQELQHLFFFPLFFPQLLQIYRHRELSERIKIRRKNSLPLLRTSTTENSTNLFCHRETCNKFLMPQYVVSELANANIKVLYIYNTPSLV